MRTRLKSKKSQRLPHGAAEEICLPGPGDQRTIWAFPRQLQRVPINSVATFISGVRRMCVSAGRPEEPQRRCCSFHFEVEFRQMRHRICIGCAKTVLTHKPWVVTKNRDCCRSTQLTTIWPPHHVLRLLTIRGKPDPRFSELFGLTAPAPRPSRNSIQFWPK